MALEASRAQVGVASVIDLDADLAAGLSDADRDALRGPTTVRLTRAEPGAPWQPPAPSAPDASLGLLVIDGVLTRDVTVAGVGCTELIGAGDLLRPWGQYPRSVPVEVGWSVLRPARLAVLDGRFGRAIQRSPLLALRLVERTVRLSQSQAIHLAITCLTGVEVRLHVLFWHLADRWGKVTPSGVVLDLPLTHEVLGRLVRSRRPSVSTALGQLADREVLLRREDGTWLLRGNPPEDLERFAAPPAGDRT